MAEQARTPAEEALWTAFMNAKNEEAREAVLAQVFWAFDQKMVDKFLLERAWILRAEHEAQLERELLEALTSSDDDSDEW